MFSEDYFTHACCVRPVSVPALHLENGEEFRLFERGERNYNDKKALRKTSLREYTPNDEESDLIHAMWMAELGYKSTCRFCEALACTEVKLTDIT